jgi:hypothetical protein
MKKLLSQCYCKMNLTKKAADHLIGENHTLRHRMVIGAVVMIGGVIFSKSFAGSHYIIHYGADVLGYLAHGIGGLPYVEQVLKSVKDTSSPS